MSENKDSNEQEDTDRGAADVHGSPDDEQWLAAVTERKRVEQESDGRDLIS